MKYNFDEVVDRRNSDCFKWDTLETAYGDKDILPMWVADMDFKSPVEILDSLKDRVDHGVLGYNFRSSSYYDSIINWVKTRYNWNIKEEWIVYVPGVVTGINLVIRALTHELDEVIIQPPIYPPFANSINNNNRILIKNPLTMEDGKYTINFDELEDKLKTAKTLIFCSPHNPVGRVWTKDELEKVAKLCVDNNAIIISDEIHCDLTFKGNKHLMIGSLSEDIAKNSITLIAPSKTFNIAGLFTSIAIIPNKEIRRKINAEIEAIGLDHTNIFGAVALEAAYCKGGEWLEELLVYLEDNADFAIEYVKKHIPEIKITKPEGTFLLWLDCRGLGLNQEELNNLMIKKAKVLLNDGSTYGREGIGFLRLNIGCPRAMVEEALKRIEMAVKQINN